MKKSLTIIVITVLLFAAYSCKRSIDPSGSQNATYLDQTVYKTYYNDTLTGNSTLNQKANLGRVLFYDKHLSVNNAIACGSCHKQEFAFADNASFSLGYEGHLTGRNSPAIQNLISANVLFFKNGFSGVDNFTLFWDGRETNLQNLVARPMTNHVEMGITDFSTLAEKLAQLPYYAQLFTNAYGDNTISQPRIAECISYFLASMNTHNSRFEQFIQNGNGFTALEIKGYNLFISTYNCSNCHHIFTNSYGQQEAFRDIGLDAVYKDMGRGTITGLASDNGKFKVPHLNNIALTAPYMHDGRFKTLDEVIDHYSSGIQGSSNLDTQLCYSDKTPKNMHISESDKQALIAFLNSMTDYTFITDPKFSDPFKQQ